MTYRVYFNRWNEWPRIWSVDEGTQDTEVTVAEVVFDGVTGRTLTGKGDNINSPTAWIEVHGFLTMEGHIATISRGPVSAPMPLVHDAVV